MISLTTAKLLLFIALCLGPKCSDSDHTIQITSGNSYVVWTENNGEWTATQKGYASHQWDHRGLAVPKNDLDQLGRKNTQIAREISNHDWTHDSTLYLENGDVAEKRGNQVFFTINAGSPNQQIFTIQTVVDGDPVPNR